VRKSISSVSGPAFLAAAVAALLVAPRPARSAAPSGAGAPPPAENAPQPSRLYTPEEIDAELQRIPGLLVEGSYDLATALLNSMLSEVREDTARLRTVYLLLIETYITRGNYFAYRLRERETAKLFYKEAEHLVLECLRTEELRDVTPAPPEDYPPEMVEAFEKIRSENFGSFRILSLDPLHAAVEIDGTFVPRGRGTESSLIRNLAVGPHEIVIRSDGYRPVRDQFRISPNSTLEKSYALEKPKSAGWYISRGAVLVAAGTLTWLMIDSGSSPDPVLPGAPPPPPD
jgi:hypothetical protein